MKNIARIISAILSTTLLASVITVAPFSVSAAEIQNNAEANTITFESKVEFSVNESDNINDHINEQVHTSESTIPSISSVYLQQNNKGSAFVGATEEYTSGDYKYTINNEKATITGYLGSMEEVSLPNVIDNYLVIGIGNNAFSNNKVVKSIKIPDNVSSIGYSAFEGCTSLTSIVIPKSVKEVTGYYNDHGIFANCNSLTTVEFENGTVSILSLCSIAEYLRS